jgi:hypothetical protein
VGFLLEWKWKRINGPGSPRSERRFEMKSIQLMIKIVNRAFGICCELSVTFNDETGLWEAMICDADSDRVHEAIMLEDDQGTELLVCGESLEEAIERLDAVCGGDFS